MISVGYFRSVKSIEFTKGSCSGSNLIQITGSLRRQRQQILSNAVMLSKLLHSLLGQIISFPFFVNDVVEHWNCLKDDDVCTSNLCHFKKSIDAYFTCKGIWYEVGSISIAPKPVRVHQSISNFHHK